MLQIDKILYFWFGAHAKEAGRQAKWFVPDKAFDDAIKEQFFDDVEEALVGNLDEFAETAESFLALIILLDQFPRNLFRGTAKSFAGDARALALAKSALTLGYDRSLGQQQNIFMYLPFQHSEVLKEQEKSVTLYGALGNESSLDFANRHYDVIQRFGRFPGRNEALGRTSTPEEIKFLSEQKMGF